MAAVLTKRTAGWLILAFSLAVILLKIHHESWRDESEVWLIARDSPGLFALLRQIGYTGSPALWYLLVYPLAQSGLPYASMAALHFVLGLGAVALFIFYAPLTFWQKVLFVFGYYVMYEYTVIMRSYILTVLMLFALAAVYKERFRIPVPYSAGLFFLANANVHGLVIAMVLGGFYAAELFLEKRPAAEKKYFYAGVIFLAGIVLAVVQLWPPKDLHIEYKMWFANYTPAGQPHIFFQAFTQAFFPVSGFHTNFWNTNILSMRGGGLLGAGCAVFLGWLFFASRPRVLGLYFLLNLVLAGIFIGKRWSGYRHSGLLYIVFIFCLWVSSAYAENSFFKKNRLWGSWDIPRLRNGVLLALLSVHVFGGVVAAYYEFRCEFSPGKKAAKYLLESGYLGPETLVMSWPSHTVESILPYIPKGDARFYQFGPDRYATYITWDQKAYESLFMSAEQIISKSDQAVLENKFYTTLFILSDDLTRSPEFNARYESLAAFDGGVVADERFYIWRLRKPSLPLARQAPGFLLQTEKY